MNAATGRSAEDPFGPWPRLVQVPRRRRHWQDKGQAMGHGRSERKEDGPRGQPCWAGTTVPASQTPVAREAH